MRAGLAVVVGVCACAAAGGPVAVPDNLGFDNENQLFVEHDVQAGITPFLASIGSVSGIAAADYDDDGDVDLFLPTRSGSPNRLYRNQGDGTFQEIAASVGLASTENGRCALWFDVDGDGRLDLAVLNDTYAGFWQITETLRLYRQKADGTFTDITAGSGVEGFPIPQIPTRAGGLAAGDVDGDGRLDLIATTWHEGFHLYRNTGGAFTEITSATGLANDAGTYWQPVFHDVNGDGLQDVFIAQDFAPNRLLINDGIGGFTNQAAAWGVATAWNEMGAQFADPDCDGDLDLYVTNIWSLVGLVRRHNVYFEAGPGSFLEKSTPVGVAKGGWGWGATFLDFDLDGRLDLAEVNDSERTYGYEHPWRLWQHDGPVVGQPVYRNVSRQMGFDYLGNGSGLVSADLDRDGDLELIAVMSAGRLLVLDNRAAQVHPERAWLVVRPRMPGTPNTHAIGAVVRVTTGVITRTRLISAGTSFMSQEPAEAHFGLAGATVADSVTVEWPDGTSTTLTNVPLRQVLDVVKP